MSILDDLYQADLMRSLRTKLVARTKELKKAKNKISKLETLLEETRLQVKNLETKLKTKVKKPKQKEQEVIDTSSEETSDNS